MTTALYSWTSSAFYFGYLVASYPVSLGFVKFPLGKYLSTMMYASTTSNSYDNILRG